MFKKLKNLVLIATALSGVIFPVVALPTAALAAPTLDIKGNLCGGTDLHLDTPSNDCTSNGSLGNFNNLLTTIVNIFSAIVGVIAVIMIIVGGLRYIMSGGDSSNVGTAKNTIVYALVGLVIVALAQLIVHFVLTQAQTVTNSGA